MRISDWSSDVCSSDLYWLGETYYVRQRYQDAAVAFLEGYQKYPKSPKAADNLLKLGMALGPVGQKAADRKSVVTGKSVSVRVDLGGSRKHKKKTKTHLSKEKCSDSI